MNNENNSLILSETTSLLDSEKINLLNNVYINEKVNTNINLPNGKIKFGVSDENIYCHFHLNNEGIKFLLKHKILNVFIEIDYKIISYIYVKLYFNYKAIF